jgi:FPC/CPF motif-containing protein YcgG
MKARAQLNRPGHRDNPFDDETSRDSSCYSAYRDEQLITAETGEEAPKLAQRVHDALRALVLDPEYPCVGSRSVINQGSYRFGMYDEMNTPAATAGLAHDLFEFVLEQPEIGGEFSSFIACFDAPKALEPEEFEKRLWEQLGALHELDREHHTWDPSVSSDPADPQFSFSFAGRAFFVVGLSPAGERWARTFPWPTLVFNAHFQFEELRESEQFERMRDVIRQRDAEIEGGTNPNLADFGEHTEARQYAGREAGEDWRCPVSFE